MMNEKPFRIVLHLRVNSHEEAIKINHAILPWKEVIFRPYHGISNDERWSDKRRDFILRCMIPQKEYTMTQLCRILFVKKRRRGSYKTLQRDIATMAAIGLDTVRRDRTGTPGQKTLVKRL